MAGMPPGKSASTSFAMDASKVVMARVSRVDIALGEEEEAGERWVWASSVRCS